MPVRRFLPLIAAVALLVPCASASAIVAGTSTPITTVPFQAAVLSHTEARDYYAQFCGAVIRDSTHVLTAAHCVYDPSSGRTAPPAAMDVLTGTSTLSLTSTSSGTRAAVQAVAFDPRYDPVTGAYDTAILTVPDLGLSPIGTLNATRTAITISNTTPTVPTTFRVSGWGTTTSGGSAPTDLRYANVPLVDDATCQTDYAGAGGIVPADMICAGDGVHDSCQGDSGGPLTTTASSPPLLAGTVSFGVGCADPAFPGVYTELSNADMQSFATIAAPGTAPSGGASPTISTGATSGKDEVGSPIICDAGAGWAGQTSFDFSWQRVTGYDSSGFPLETPLTGWSPNHAYTPTSADLGTQIQCRARAKNAAGYEDPYSAPVLINAATPPPTLVQTTPTPRTNTTPPPAKDVTPPTSRVVKSLCTRTSCRVTIAVTDSGVSSGLRTPTVIVRSQYKATCRKHGKRATCTKTVRKTLSPQLLGAGQYVATAEGLHAGSTNTFTISAVDAAGNTQIVATRKVVHTTKPKAKKAKKAKRR